jgi:hypothetical protein
MMLTFFPFDFHLVSHNKPNSCNIIHYSLLIRTRQINYDSRHELTTTIAFVTGQAGYRISALKKIQVNIEALSTPLLQC